MVDLGTYSLGLCGIVFGKSQKCFCSTCPAGEDEDQFEQFMLPLTAAFETVAQMLSTNTFNEQEAKVITTNAHVLKMLQFFVH